MSQGLWPLALAAILVLGLPASPPAATTEQIVTDPKTGLALSGIDPVGYFTNETPVAGLPEHEVRYAGAVWRFRNPGNLAAFMADPDVYMPRYGGYDAVAMGRGVAVAGNPLVWAITAQRLYLFFNEAARTRFMAEPDEAIFLADNKWPAIMKTLVR